MPDTTDILFRIGCSGTATGISDNPSLDTFIERIAGPEMKGAGWQHYLPSGGILIPAGQTAWVDLTSGLFNQLNEEITGANAFKSVYCLYVEHALESDADLVTIQFGGGNNFSGIFTTTDPDAYAVANIPKDSEFAFAISVLGNGCPIVGEITPGEVTAPFTGNGWEIPISNPSAGDALIFLGIFGKLKGS